MHCVISEYSSESLSVMVAFESKVRRGEGGVCVTVRASLSGTFFPTLPGLATPLKVALFICAQLLSTDAVGALRKVWAYDWKHYCVQARTWAWGASAPRLKKKKSSVDCNGLGFIGAGADNVCSYKRNAWLNLSCLSQIFCRLSTNKKLPVSWHFFSVIIYGSGWRKDVVNQCLERDRESPRSSLQWQSRQNISSTVASWSAYPTGQCTGVTYGWPRRVSTHILSQACRCCMLQHHLLLI